MPDLDDMQNNPYCFLEKISTEELKRILQEDFKKFASSLREVLNYIKYSKDENELTRLLAEDERLKADMVAYEKQQEYIKKTEPEYYPPVENLLDLIYEHYTENKCFI